MLKPASAILNGTKAEPGNTIKQILIWELLFLSPSQIRHSRSDIPQPTFFLFNILSD